MISALDFGKPSTTGVRFGVDVRAAAARLRRLADEIESGQTLVHQVEVSGSASAEDFTHTFLALDLVERAQVVGPSGDGG